MKLLNTNKAQIILLLKFPTPTQCECSKYNILSPIRRRLAYAL